MMTKKRKNIWKMIYPYLYLIPLFMFMVVFLLKPFMMAITKSFYDYDMVTKDTFIGLGNYIELFTSDPKFVTSMKNLIPLLIGMIVCFQFPIIAAKLVISVKSDKLQYFFRMIFLIPMGVPGVVTLLMWKFLYYPDVGVFARLFEIFGLNAPNFLGLPRYAMWAAIFIGFPWISGLNFIITYSALQGIDESISEAAELDGAGSWTKFFKIDFPLIMPQLKALLILGIIGTVQQYEKFLILTQGGPSNSTLVPGLHMYNMAFGTNGNYGYSCAIAVVLFLLTLVLVMATMKWKNKSNN